MEIITVKGREELVSALVDAAELSEPRQIAVEGTSFVVTLGIETGPAKAWWLKEGNGPGLYGKKRLTKISNRVKRSAKKLWG